MFLLLSSFYVYYVYDLYNKQLLLYGVVSRSYGMNCWRHSSNYIMPHERQAPGVNTTD